MEDFSEFVFQTKEEAPPPPRRPRRILVPRREPTIILPPFVPYYPTPDKVTCAECGCFPKEDPYVKPKKMNPCQHSPALLYELAASAVERLVYPPALRWTEEDVQQWADQELGLPQYKECFSDNHIDGNRLLMLEDPSKPPMINIHDFEHIKKITQQVRKLYGMDFIRFARSIGLPPRRPLVHCNWFKSRTGPSWGIRQNWSRADLLRWMKILMPAPVHRDHWDLVWFLRPDYPCVRFARIRPPRPLRPARPAPPLEETSHEYLVRRKFRLQSDIPEDQQMIWMQRRPHDVEEMKRKEQERKRREKAKRKREIKFIIKDDSNLMPKKVTQEGKRGDALILARRKTPTPKFLVNCDPADAKAPKIAKVSK